MRVALLSRSAHPLHDPFTRDPVEHVRPDQHAAEDDPDHARQADPPGETHGEVLSRALAEAGVYPDELHRREESLEEMFLAITGAPEEVAA